MQNYIEKANRKVRRKRQFKFFLKALKNIIILLILISILKLGWSRYGGQITRLTKNSFSTYMLIRECKDLEKYQEKYLESEAYGLTVRDCGIIGIELN